MKNNRILLNGLFKKNPALVMLLGMCPLLAVSTSVEKAIGMGLSVVAVLITSNVIISSVRKVIPAKVRIAVYVVIISSLVTITELTLKAYLPDLASSLGVFLPLIAVNCLILERAESFASRNNVYKSALDGLGMGFGFTAALIAVSTVREVLGSGTFLNMPLFGDSFRGAAIMLMPAGGFLTLAVILASIRVVSGRVRKLTSAGEVAENA